MTTVNRNPGTNRGYTTITADADWYRNNYTTTVTAIGNAGADWYRNNYTIAIGNADADWYRNNNYATTVTAIGNAGADWYRNNNNIAIGPGPEWDRSGIYTTAIGHHTDYRRLLQQIYADLSKNSSELMDRDALATLIYRFIAPAKA